MSEETQAAQGAQGDQTEPKPAQGTLPGVADDKEKTISELKAQLEKFRAETKKAKEEASARKRDAETKKAIEEGKAQEALIAQSKMLDEERAKREEMEAAVAARVERNIAKLSEAQKAEVEIIKDHLPLAKLDEIVESKLASSGQKAEGAGSQSQTETKQNPPPTSNPGRTQDPERRKLSPEGYEKIAELGGSAELSELLVREEGIGGKAVYKFPIQKMMQNLKERAYFKFMANDK